MGVVVTGRDYRNRNRAEIIDWLLGNVGDWQTLNLVLDIAVEKKFTTGAPLLLDGADITLGDGTEWSSYGFDVGDTINISYTIVVYDSDGNEVGSVPFTQTRTITLIQGGTINVSGADIGGSNFNMMPTERPSYKIINVITWVDKRPQGAVLTYGHLENSDISGANLHSFIDGTLTRFNALGMDTLSGWQNMEALGNQSGMSIKSAKWIYLNKIGSNVYRYKFSIEFLISSFFEDLTNFELMTAPSQVFDAKSLTDNFEVVALPEWNNPNTTIKSDKLITKRLGNTGWFNENFNALDNNFEVLGLTYTDVATGGAVSKLSYGTEVRVKAIIGGIGNIANGLTKLNIGFVWLPEEESFYKIKETPYHENLLMNTAGGYSTGVFSPSVSPLATTYQGFTSDPTGNKRMDVKDVHFYQLGSNLIYEATFKPTAGFNSFIGGLEEVERNYAIWVSVADRTLVTNFADRVSLLLDYNKLELNIPPVGEWIPMSIGFLEHPQDENSLPEVCYNDFHVEDDILSKIEFEVDITKDIPSAMSFVIEAERLSDGLKFELQSYKVDLSGFPVDGNGVPQWNYDQTRGFKYGAGYNKNFVKVRRNAGLDNGNNYGYEALFGWKVRWEDWITRTGVPSDFYNSALENNGFGNDWIAYLNTAGWKINFTVYTEALLNGNLVRYTNERQISFKDYDSNTNVNDTWEFRRSNGALIAPMTDTATGEPLGVLFDGEQIEVTCYHEKITGTFSPIANYYATITIEIDKGAGQFEHRQISSVWSVSEADNPLKPIVGFNKLALQLSASNKVKLRCLIDVDSLGDAKRYKLSSRIGCK